MTATRVKYERYWMTKEYDGVRDGRGDHEVDRDYVTHFTSPGAVNFNVNLGGQETLTRHRDGTIVVVSESPPNDDGVREHTIRTTFQPIK